MDANLQPGPAAIWRDAFAQGRLLLQRDPASGKLIFPPRPLAGGAGDWIEASRRGTIYASTTIAPRPPDKPYHVVLVDLEEGPRIMGNLALPGTGPPGIGQQVVADIVDQDTAPRLLFRPA